MIVQCRGRPALREREQAPPLSVLQNLAIVADDPVARSAPAPADIIEPPELHRRPELQTSLKRNGDVDQQPQRRREPVGLRQSSLEFGERLARTREGRDLR